ncbi:Conserved hypothetical protein [Candidatus Protochlamydia naegleriophila]|uniref:USP domain-containing protein n=1 Tax=Candidatus Protochlamydia naegleriophila TaxID=389348 RepID=A0A0U5JEV1_9BACT|nr:ubiquitin carboxyl-terminal hydrolase family protein [Candidatus Protochlamydia naegleriophila]CUI17122.1 Conserved hypothetical protein [Candidatus Protochlamydia naegleriophila]
MSIPDVSSPIPGPILDHVPPLTDPVPPPMPQPVDPQVQAVQRRIDFSRVSQTLRVMAERVKHGKEVILAFVSWRLFIIREVFLRLIFVPSINPHDRSFVKLIDSFEARKPSLERQLLEMQNSFMHRAAVRGDLKRLSQLKMAIEQTTNQLRLFTEITQNWQPALPIHDRMIEMLVEYGRLCEQLQLLMNNKALHILREFYGIASPFLQSEIALPASIRDDLYETWLLVERHVIPFFDPARIPREFHVLIDTLIKARNRPDNVGYEVEFDRPLPLRNIDNSCYIDSTLHMLFSQDVVRKRLVDYSLDETITQLELELQNPELPAHVVNNKVFELREKKHNLDNRKQLQHELKKLMHGGEYVHQDPISYLDYFLAVTSGPSVAKIRKLVADGQFNGTEFNPLTMRAQLDAASFLDILMKEILEYPFNIQKVANTPAMPGRLFASPQEPVYGLHLGLHTGVRDLNALIASNLGVEVVDEVNERYQRVFDPQEGIIIDAEAAVGEVQPMRVQQYSVWHRLKSLQDIMTIQIKRFEVLPNGLTTKKENEIDLPEDGIIDLTPYYDAPIDDDKGARYEIKGMVVHSGGLHGGHYTARVKQGEHYWSCDDVRPDIRRITKEEFFANKKPYLLILQRIEPRQPNQQEHT